MTSRFFHSIIFLAMSLTAVVDAFGQKGEITGRVVAEDGAGVPNLAVFLSPLTANRGSQIGSRAETQMTDEEGNFKFTGLSPRSYNVTVGGSKAYVQPVSSIDDLARFTYRIGQTAVIRLVKGGVITGKVTTATGEPMIGVYVSPQMIKDAEGRPIRQTFGSRPRVTDDRGIYRLYGLSPGTYIVSTVAEWGGGRGSSAYEGSVPTFYPSATRDTAGEVSVSLGSETPGIDIRYRGEMGHVVSGVVTGGGEPSQPYIGTSVTLINVATGASAGGGGFSPFQGNNGFAIYGVIDGEYDLYAFRGGYNQEPGVASAPRRITVRGADVGGLELKLAPTATIDGAVTLEPAAPACELGRKSVLEEIRLSLRKDPKAALNQSPPSPFGQGGGGVENGQFSYGNLYAGKYFLFPNLPSDHWYVKSILARPATPRGRGSSASATDYAQNGFSVSGGEKLTGVTMTLAEGGSVLEGKVAPSTEGASLPAHMRIFLIPADAAAGDQLLRYSESALSEDRTFQFKNLAAGRYWALARPIPDSEAIDRTQLPLIFESGERGKLRKDAESRKQEVEVKPCQRIKDFVLKW